MTFFFVQYGPVLEIEPSTYGLSILVFVLICIILFAQQKIASNLLDAFEKNSKQTHEFLAQEKQRKDNLIEQTQMISDNMNNIRESSEENKESLDQMSRAFQGIATGMENQSESITSISRSVEETGEKVMLMDDSMQLLEKKTEEASQVTQQVEHGNSTIENHG
ncbi:methyl-accepting chemotaxis protein [Caldalkalibacillus mannanilyticus]|uniref:methyl-accepting chemotaxis protein n=1 Tax=Caldalkalibacillus mannanilyticus TaxID=1418 RepID=UPI000AE8930A|nr:methyl-accepting chemotaxis protein [Caldalkalibacillus mannanilyticus]